MVELKEITQSLKFSLENFSTKIWKEFFPLFPPKKNEPKRERFLSPTNPRSVESKLSLYNEVFFSLFPLQTKGKKVLIAFCMAIKKLLQESQPRGEKKRFRNSFNF